MSIKNLAAQPSAGAQPNAIERTYIQRLKDHQRELERSGRCSALAHSLQWAIDRATPAQPDTGAVEALREALSECQKVFADYAEMHRHKLTHMLTEHQRKDIHRKIERNRDMSDMCLAALSTADTQGAHEDGGA
jgi:hypothetical protein